MPSRSHISKKQRYVLRIAILLLASFSLLLSGQAAEVTKVARNVAPAWVKPRVVDFTAHPAEGEASDGTWDVLVDEQDNVREKSSYSHFATLYLTQGGVKDSSRISISFDPAYQTLVLNKLVVWRNGKVMDRLPKQDVKLLHREASLDRLLYDGRLSAEIILDDIRVGDILEYAYTIRGENPIFEGRYVDSFGTVWSSPVHRMYHRLLWPANRQLTIKSFREDVKPVITTHDATVEYEWEKKNIAALASDGDLPSWFDPYGWVELSEFKSWHDVAQWSCGLSKVQDKTSDRMKEEIDKIKTIADRKNQVVAALRFVQDNIRYLGIEVGAHSHKPYPIDTVLQRRFGDCKDKALLLSSLLRQLGFEAYPAMVETNNRQSITEWLPTPLAFNHMVVQLRLDGRTYWLDPTRSNQGGNLDDIYFPDYGVALVASADTDSLTKITPQGYDKAKKEVTETYQFPDFKGEATLKVHTVYHGRDADSMRGWIADTSMDEVKKNFLNFYAKQYPHIEAAAAPTFSDDFEKNEIVSEESYRINQFWQPHTDNKERLYGDFDPRILRDLVSKPSTSVRTMPFVISHPVCVRQTIRLLFPRGMKFTTCDFTVDDPAFKYNYKRELPDNEVDLIYSYESRQNYVEAARTAEYNKNIDDVLNGIQYEIWVGKPTAGDSKAVASAPPAASLNAGDEQADLGSKKWLLLLPFVLSAVIWAFLWLLSKRKRGKGPPPFPIIEASLHRCVLCGKTEITAPDSDFRVAIDGEEYCALHLPKAR